MFDTFKVKNNLQNVHGLSIFKKKLAIATMNTGIECFKPIIRKPFVRTMR